MAKIYYGVKENRLPNSRIVYRLWKGSWGSRTYQSQTICIQTLPLTFTSYVIAMPWIFCAPEIHLLKPWSPVQQYLELGLWQIMRNRGNPHSWGLPSATEGQVVSLLRPHSYSGKLMTLSEKPGFNCLEFWLIYLVFLNSLNSDNPCGRGPV